MKYLLRTLIAIAVIEVILIAAALMLVPKGVLAADTKISALPAASALTGVEAFPCVQGGVTDKCTVTQAVTFTYSLLSGDCTATSGGAITCTKTGGVAFSALATASVPLSIANGGNGTASPGLTAGTGITLGSTWPTQSVALTSPVTIANGGTGQTSAANAFNALSPMTTVGDIIYGGASGVGTRLANGTTGQYLGANTGAAPSWSTPAGATSPPVWSDFSTSFIYPVYPHMQSITAGLAGTANLIVCTPGIISQKMTLSGLGLDVTTISAAGNFQTAIYKSASGRPGVLVAASASGSTGATGLITPALSANKQVGPGGTDADSNLWFCSNRDNAVVVFLGLNIITPSATLIWTMMGSATLGNITSTGAAANAITCSGANCNGGSSTFNTWPSTLAGSTWSDNVTRAAPVFFYQPNSIP